MIFMLEQALAHPQGEPLATEATVEHWQALAAADRHAPAFLPPTRGTVYGTLLNHRDALVALGDQVNAAPYKAPPKAPILYIKPRNTVVGHRVPVVVPADVAELEMGATLGVVIGRTASRVAGGRGAQTSWRATPSSTTSACRMRRCTGRRCASNAVTASAR